MTQTTTGIQRIADDYGTAALVVGVLLVFGLLPFGADFMGYSTNIYTELISVALTILVLDRRAQQREMKRQREERIARIIRGMRSTDDNEGLRAAEQAEEIGILTDGTLSEVNLERANLSRASLWGANLSRADLREVNLSGAYLWGANLSRADLQGADLSGVDLWEANLSEADLQGVDLSRADLRGANLNRAYLTVANLSRADLREANLSGVDLRGANLSRADLGDATFDGETTLPDSTIWISDTDITRYTDPNHPNHWQTDFVAAGFSTKIEWVRAGVTWFDGPRPWMDAGYGKNEWNEWVRDGKPGPWQAMDMETWQEWVDARRPRPWIAAGYGWYEWNEWVRDGRPDRKPTDDTST
ncbi:MAG: pentapeptide repeat-containing protein [Chloroflexota bacterium]